MHHPQKRSTRPGSQLALTSNWYGALMIASAACSLVSCRPNENTAPGFVMTHDTKNLVTKAAQLRVFFNHQSVGTNILSGLNDLVRATGTEWSVAELAQGSTQWPPGLGIWHATLGENGRPKTKIDSFAQALRSVLGDKPQVAMMKLCFVDVTSNTEIEELLQYYATAVNSIKQDYPELVIVHVTVPLATREASMKATVKRMLGLTVSTDASNLVRTKYNRRLRETFPNDAIWDLETLESTHPDGSRVKYPVQGEMAFGLAPEYASDPWGHLNALGGQKAAAELAKTLAAAGSQFGEAR